MVTGSPYATEAGVRLLEASGNAVDAAVAAAFTLAVAEPTQSGLGGRTQLVLRTAGGQIRAVDGGTEVPAGYDRETAPSGETGYGAVGIPGTVAALTLVHREHGRLGLSEVLAPAIEWAEGGVVLPAGERRRLGDLVAEEGPGSTLSRLFDVVSDSVLVQPALARTLRTIAVDGHDGFYRGEVAASIAEDIAAGGGFVSETDLATYRALDARVGRIRIAGVEVIGSYLPASGVTVAQILAILDGMELPEEEWAWAEAVAGALVVGFEDRETAEGMLPDAAVAWLTSDSLLDRRARELSGTGEEDGTLALAARPGAGMDEVEPPFTSHVSVADTFGNVVALTQSLGPTGGARVATMDLGFLYASTLGGYLTAGGPGYRPWSSQAPLMVVNEDGPFIVAGGAGARRIISAMVTTLSRVFHRGMGLEDAMAAPRLHPTGGRIYIEEGWEVGEFLAERGHDVQEREGSYFARLNVIEVGDGQMTGIAQAEWSGASAAGPR